MILKSQSSELIRSIKYAIMKSYFLFTFITIMSMTDARHKCSNVKDCFPYCQEPDVIAYGVKEAFCLNGYCSCGEAIQICFSEEDCWRQCRTDSLSPHRKRPLCTENGYCECLES